MKNNPTSSTLNSIAPSSSPMDPEELAGLADLARQQANKALAKIPLLGPVTWLMLQQAATRHTLISELEWRVLPALILDQAKLYLKNNAPIAFVSWARLNDAAAQRYRTSPHQLAMTDWASGDQVWLIDLLTPFGGAQDVLKDLRENVFVGQVVHQLVPIPKDTAKILAWPAMQPSEPGVAH